MSDRPKTRERRVGEREDFQPPAGGLTRRVDRWLQLWWRVAPRGRPEVRTTLTVLVGSAVAMLGSFVTRVLMARALTPAELGLLLLAIAIASPVAGLLSLGLSQAAALVVADRLAAGDETGARRAAASALLLAGTSGAVGTVAIVLSASAIARTFTAEESVEPLRSLLWAVAPIVATLPIGLAMLGVHRGHGGATARAVLRDGGGGVSRALGVGLAVVAGARATTLGIGFSLGAALSDLVYVAYGAVRGWIGDLRGRLDRQLLARLRGFAPLQLVTELRRWADVLTVGLVLDARAVGFYGLARGFGRVLEAIQQAPVHSFLPTATTLDDAELRPLQGRVRDLTLALLWIPAVLCLLAPAAIVVPVVGEEYRAAASLLAWFACAVLVDVAWGFNHQVLLARGGERPALVATLAAIAVTVISVLLVAPRWGVIGAAACLAVTELLRVGLISLFLRRAGYRQPPPPAIVVVALAGLVGVTAWRWIAAIEGRAGIALAISVALVGAGALAFVVARGGAGAEARRSGLR